MEEKDVFFAAGTTLRLYGDEAALHAAQRADTLLDRGDLAGVATWRRILAAIGELQRERPGGAVH
ncbi:MAG: hypothetical protein RIM84_21050 [Alphaproteobacteria bacterium]